MSVSRALTESGCRVVRRRDDAVGRFGGDDLDPTLRLGDRRHHKIREQGSVTLLERFGSDHEVADAMQPINAHADEATACSGFGTRPGQGGVQIDQLPLDARTELK